MRAVAGGVAMTTVAPAMEGQKKKMLVRKYTCQQDTPNSTTTQVDTSSGKLTLLFLPLTPIFFAVRRKN